MEAAAPALLSGVAGLLLRRPPSLRELVTLVGYADDYAWFVGLVRRLFPLKRLRRRSRPPTYARGWSDSPISSESALPPLRTLLHRVLDGGRGGATSLDLDASGHPLRPDGLRLRRPPRAVARLPRGHLGPGPAGQAPRRLLRGTRRYTDGLAGVGRRAHPARRPCKDSPGRHTLDDLTGALKETEVRGGGQGRLLGLRRDRQLLSRPYLRGWQLRRLRRPLGGRDHRRGHGGVAQGQRPHGLGVHGWPTGWRRTSPAASPRCWTSSCRCSPIQEQEQEENDHDQ